MKSLNDSIQEELKKVELEGSDNLEPALRDQANEQPIITDDTLRNVTNHSKRDNEEEVVIEEKVDTKVYTYSQLMDLKFDLSDRYLLDNLLLHNGISFLVGSSEAGKSYFALDLAIAICNKEDSYLNIKLKCKHNNAIFVSTEDSVEDIYSRLALMKHEKVKRIKDSLRFVMEFQNLPKVLKRLLTESPADLIVIDTFGDLFNKDINNAPHIRSFLKPYKDIANKFNIQILFLHHIGKGKENNATPSKNDVLGSQGIESAARTVLSLRELPNDQRALTLIKSNHTKKEKKNKGFILKFDETTGFTSTGDIIDYSQGCSSNTNRKEINEKIIEKVKEQYLKKIPIRKIADSIRKEGIKVAKSKVSEIIIEHCKQSSGEETTDGQKEAA